MKIGICTSIDNAAQVKAWGFDYVEENVQNFLVPLQDDAAFAPHELRAKQMGLPLPAAAAFLPGVLKCTGPEVDFAAIEKYAATAFRRAQAVGMKKIVFGSGGARNIPDGFSREKAKEQFVECLTRIAPLAAQHEVFIAVEPLNSTECNFINSVAEGAEMVEAAEHPNVRLLVDFYHMLKDEDPVDEIITHGGWIVHAHLAEKEGRRAPGTTGFDFRPYFQALRKIGYDETISIECHWSNFEEEAPGSLKFMREQLAD